jgi:ubiquitin-protein ligase
MSNPQDTTNTVDLTVDLTEESSYTMPAAAMSSPDDVIDLSNDASEFDVQYSAYAASMEHAASNRKKRKRDRQKTVSLPQCPADIIDLDAVEKKPCASWRSASTTEDPSEAYKRALGPIRMDFVSDFYPPHAFVGQNQNQNLPTQKIFQELLEYKLNLPIQPSSSIFVRAMESRLDLLRVLITGPEGTPYANGMFLFDCYLHDYPLSPPKVKFLTTNGNQIRFNPNLYACGKVCLSLLGTWSGPGWQANQSTLLQVLVSIQGLVLVPDPFFNEPGFDPKVSHLQIRSQSYNKNIRKYTLQFAIRDALHHVSISSTKLYPEFAQVVQQHFATRAESVRAQLQEWTNADPTVASLTAEVQSLLDTKQAAQPQKPPPEPIEILI